jgi:hypothetical protein
MIVSVIDAAPRIRFIGRSVDIDLRKITETGLLKTYDEVAA